MIASDNMYPFINKILLFYIYIHCLHSASSLRLQGTLEKHISDQNGDQKIAYQLLGDFNESLGVLRWTRDGSLCDIETVPHAYSRTISIVTKFWTFEKDKGAFTLNTIGRIGNNTSVIGLTDRSDSSLSTYFEGRVVCRATILRNASVLKIFDSDILYTLIKLPNVIITKSTGVSHDRPICCMKRSDGYGLKWRSDYTQLNAEDYADSSNVTHQCTKLIKEFTKDTIVYCQYCRVNEVLEEYMTPITIRVKKPDNTATTNTSANVMNYTTMRNMVTSTTSTSTMATSSMDASDTNTSDMAASSMNPSDTTTSTTAISDTNTSDMAAKSTPTSYTVTHNSSSAPNSLVYALSATLVLCISIAVCAVLYYRTLALRQASVRTADTTGPSSRTATGTLNSSPLPTQRQSSALSTALDITGYMHMDSNVRGIIPIYDQIKIGQCDSVIPQYSNLEINEPTYEYIECDQFKKTPVQPTHLSSFRKKQ